MSSFKKRLFVGIAATLLLLAPFEFLTSSAFAKGRGGGGRSYSSGRSSYSSPSRSYSSPSRSYSSPKSSYKAPSGKSYSSGSKSGSKSYTAPSSRSYSRGSGKPSTPSKSYSSPYSSGKGKSSSTASGNSYSSSPGSGVSGSRQSSNSGFNRGMTASQRKDASKAAYQKKIEASKPKPTYTVNGKTRTVTPTQTKTQADVRKYVTHERYVTYDNRASSFYGSSYGTPHYYNDSFSPFLFGYLMSSAMNSHDRASWMYHHRDSMDEARYREMLAKDAKLEAEIAKLKENSVPVDPDFVPEGMDKDIMYDKQFINASLGVDQDFDPSAGLPPVATATTSQSSGSSTFLWVFGIMILVVVFGVLGYLVFVKDY